MVRRVVVAILGCLAVASTPGAASTDGQPVPTPMFYEGVAVPLVTLDVVVTDGAGEPIRDLGAEDFEVFEDGRRVEISHFANLSSAAAGFDPENDPSSLVLYFDDVNAVPRRRASVLDSLDAWLPTLATGGIRTMVAHFDGALRVDAELTDSVDVIREALAKLRSAVVFDPTREADDVVRDMEAARASLDLHRRDGQVVSPGVPASDLAVYMIGDFGPRIDAYANATVSRNRASMAGLERVFGLLRGVPGRKAVLWVGNLQTRPAEDLYATWRQLLPEQASRGGSALSANRYNLTGELRDLAESASSHMVVVYGIGSLGSSRTSRVSTETRSGIAAGGSGRAGEGDPWAGQEGVAVLSGMSGGRVLREGRGFPDELERVARELSSYYSMGYRPEVSDSDFHRLSVNVLDRDAQVRHRAGRRGVMERGEMVDRMTATVLLGVSDNPLGIEVDARKQEPRGDDESLVPVAIRIPIGNLSLAPEERRHSSQVTIFSLVRDERGGLSEVTERSYPLEIPNEQLLTAVGQNAEFVLGMVMRTGPHRIAIGVQDDGSMTASTVFLDVVVNEQRSDPSL